MRNGDTSAGTGVACTDAPRLNPHSDLRPQICLLSLSAIADDPRVRRQGDAFARAGWAVIGVGLDGSRCSPPDWTILTARGAAPGAQRKITLAQRIWHAVQLLWVRVCPEFSDRLYWAASPCWRISQAAEIYGRARPVRADIWLANDWTALPIAARLAAENGGRYAYDTHEFAAEEYAESRKWRVLTRPIVCTLERRFIRGAAVVSAVSAGIAERLERMYCLARPALAIRNTPDYVKTTFRPTGSRIRVLYHGIVVEGRGLEMAIDSVALWRPEFDLTIRGPGTPEFVASLRRRICDAGLNNRVHLAPPVPMTELVQQASDFDIGFFALPGHSRHNEFALPNKFFEYVMAGLTLCVSDLPEMARLVSQHGLGVLVPSLEPAAIAAAINGLDRERIDMCKRNALVAARELCWERESERMVTAYRQLVPGTASG